MAAFIESPVCSPNYLILRDWRGIQQTALIGISPPPRTTKNGRDDPCRFCFALWTYLPRLTAFFSSAPGVNFATLRAAILMVAPVCGLRPLRALRCETENVPKPISATRSPFFRAPVMLSTVVSIALAAWVLLMPQPAAMRSMRSALFIVAPGEVPFSQRQRLQTPYDGSRVRPPQRPQTG